MTQPELCQQSYSLRHPTNSGRIIRVRCTRMAGAAGPLPSVVVVHGFKGFLRWGFFPELQDRLARAGFMSVALNLSGGGVGEDLENFTEDQAFFDSTPSRDVEDLQSVLEALQKSAIPGADLDQLAVLGHSRGGGSALLHAERSAAYRAVVTWASVAHSNGFDQATLAGWRAAGVLEVRNARIGKLHRMGLSWLEDVEQNAADLDILAACSRSKTRTLLLHGDADMAVPASDMTAIQDAFGPKIARSISIPGAGHTFGAVHPWRGSTPQLEQAFEVSLSFLAEQLQV